MSQIEMRAGPLIEGIRPHRLRHDSAEICARLRMIRLSWILRLGVFRSGQEPEKTTSIGGMA